MSRASAEMAGDDKAATQLPEPGHFWIRYVPRTWEAPELPWLHLAAGGLGSWDGTAKAHSAELASLADAALDDVLYLPAVPAPLAAARDELACLRLVDGTPVLIQLFPGESTAVPPASGAAFVFDLLHVLLEHDFDALGRLPSDATAVWPLVAGLTDDLELWEQGCRQLSAAGVRCVQALAPALTPADRRRLAERWGGEEAFDALFHRPPPSERDFSRIAHRFGLEPFLPRPLPSGAGGRNRRIGGALALAGELWLRLGRPVETGQALYRDSRWADRTGYDLERVVREGNLAVLPLSPLGREIMGECALSGESERLARLLAEYVAPAETGADESRRTADAPTRET